MMSKNFSARRIAFLALLTAACVVGRLLFQVLPNVQPMTDSLLLITICTGFVNGLIVSLLAVIVSSIYLGFGYWVVVQCLSYFVILCLVGFLCNYTRLIECFWMQVILSFVVGMMYGFIVSVVQFFFFGLTAFWPYYLAGISFDLFHAMGNVCFYFLLYQPFLLIAKRFALK